jgi:hypothetical protein
VNEDLAVVDPLGETSPGAGGAGMLTVSAVEALHVPCPLAVQAYTHNN